MAKKKNRRQAHARSQRADPAGFAGSWIAFALLVGLAVGGVIGYFVGSAVSGGASAITDSYGRSPSHPHYNHNHP